MQVMIDLCVVPLGVGVSVSNYIAECEKILHQAGLETRLTHTAQMWQENGTTFLTPYDGATCAYTNSVHLA